METVVLVIMALVCFNYVLKQTCRKPCAVGLSAAVCALFVGLMWPAAIEQSKSQIAAWLSDASLMLDTATVLTVDVALHMTFCVVAAQIQTSGRIRPLVLRVYRLLRWYPGVLIFPVLFSLLTYSIFSLPGVPFPLVSWGLGGVVLLSVALGSWGVKRLLPEREIRLELLFLSNALVGVLGVVATVNGRTAVAGVGAVDWAALAGVAALVAAGTAIGAVAYRHGVAKRVRKIT